MRPTRLVLTVAAVGFALLVAGVVEAASVGTPDSTGQWDQQGTTYNVTFSETGLASGTNWSVHVYDRSDDGGWGWWGGDHPTMTSSNSSIVFTLPNGSYNYRVRGVEGYTVTSGGQGTFNVSGGSPAAIDVAFAKIVPYAVTFTESGLPAGTTWAVSVGGFDRAFGGDWERGMHGGFQRSNTTTITFELVNGSYHFRVYGHSEGLTASPRDGMFNVSGAAVSIPITFSAPTTYAVTFTESGLAAGTNWTVAVGGDFGFGEFEQGLRGGVHTSNTSTVAFDLVNGTYHFRVFHEEGLQVSPAYGTFNVSGAAVSVAITFSTPTLYSVEFNESGLPAGTNWTVYAVGYGSEGVGFEHANMTSSGTTLTLSLPNGTYIYRVARVHGFAVSGGAEFGTFTVSGASPAEISLVFVAETSE